MLEGAPHSISSLVQYTVPSTTNGPSNVAKAALEVNTMALEINAMDCLPHCCRKGNYPYGWEKPLKR